MPLDPGSPNTADAVNAARLKLQPMIHVEDMSASLHFYEVLGATLVTGNRDGDWAQLRLGRSEISLLAHPATPEAFGEQLQLEALGGLLIKINRLDLAMFA